MLSSETKRKIDNARDILVGVQPSPEQQVRQITIALIYKFMDDMDKGAQEKYGAQIMFFAGEYKKYSWTNLISPRLSGRERLNLYAEGIEKMDENKNIPQLFRDIFKDAYLPYRNEETLNLFLKQINEFQYDHSEDLGNAFEYLLSIMGAQGDAGQFRTPRHIIDFIVEIVDPQKNETMLDPACGTAGFLISAYKHILRQNTKDKPGDKLSPDDKKKLEKNLVGYDISTDMVRLALANMYLHGFQNPHIYEYDTLSSEVRWDDKFDVMMANPPFMTPKGGIKPHKRFSTQAKRSEVLFVDYIIEHLNPKGRAGIIVPEGIIFKNDTAYKALRKMLIDDGLYVVVSLPGGVFNPYSPVKTNILFFDNELSKKAKDILFVKVSNDGFDLGAQRRSLGTRGDLPHAEGVIKLWQGVLKEGGNKVKIKGVREFTLANIVSKEKISESVGYNLSGDRYRLVTDYTNAKWPLVELGEVLDYEQPTNYIVESIAYNDNYPIPVLTAGKSFILGYTNEQKGVFSNGLPVIIFDDFTTATKFVDFPFKVKSSAMKILHAKKERAHIKFLFYMMQQIRFSSSTHKRYWISQYSKIKIPLPPLEIQEQFVAELENYQKVIDGAKQVVENWKPIIDIDPKWKIEKLENTARLIRGPFGGSLKKEIFKNDGYLVYEQNHAINNDFNFGRYFIDEKKFIEMKRFEVFTDDILISCSGTMGKVAIVPSEHKKGIINQALLKLTPNKQVVLVKYLKIILESELIQQKYFRNQSGAAIPNVASVKVLSQIEIPLPSIEIQKQIVGKIDEEQKIIEANKKLIEMNQGKIQKKIKEVWGE